MMRTTITIKILIAAVVGLLMLPMATMAAEGNAADKAAEVNGTVISKKEYDRQLAMFRNQVLKGQSGQLPEALAQKLKDQVIKKLVADEILFQEAAKKGIKIEEKNIDDELNKIKGRFKDEKQYQERLKATGLTEDILKKQFRHRITVSKLIEKEIVPKVKVTEEDAKKYYDSNKDKFIRPERVRARHILMKIESGDSQEKKDEARKKLKDLQKRLVNGEDFSALAKEHSQGPSNVRGGDLGYFTRGRMVKAFEDVAFKLAPNEVSDIVETQFGYHLIKVMDHQQASEASFDETKPRIMSVLFKEQIQKKLEPYVQGLRKNAKIEIYVK